MSEIQCSSSWERTNLAALGDYLNGFAFNDRHWSDVGLPIVRIAQITGSQGIVDRYPGNLSGIYRLYDGDIIFSWSGTLAVVRWLGGSAWLNQHLFKVIPKKGIDHGFLYHVLQSSVAEIDKRSHGSTMKHIKRGELKKFRVSIPTELPEQQKIAQILDTLDTTIRQAEAIIAKLQQVKQGLLHDLLTRGIDANGQLRPPVEQAPHLYKESPLGWIPREWEINSIGQLLADVDPAMRSGPFGSALLKSELVEIGIPLLGIDNIHVERFDRNFVRFVSLKKFHELARYAVRPRDLMITIMGTVGRCCLIPDDIGSALSSKHTWAITLNQKKYLPYLAMLQINYAPWVIGHFVRDEQGGIMSAIRSETLRSALLPVPPILEQKIIEERIQNSVRRINIETTCVAKLKKEKSALMDDLLTGRVRVTALLSGETPASKELERKSA